MGGVIEGTGDLIGSTVQGIEDEKANKLTYQREQRAASFAIEGAQQKAAYEQTRQRILATQLSREQNVAYANSGIDPTQGTAGRVQANTAALSELDHQQLAVNAAREIYGLKEAKQQSTEEYLSRARGIRTKKEIGQLGAETKVTASAISFGAGGGFGGGK